MSLLIFVRDIIISSPNVKFDTIVGLSGAKKILLEAVKLPLVYPELFTGLIEPWKGVLLFGPPGTGKTSTIRSIASKFNLNCCFLSMTNANFSNQTLANAITKLPSEALLVLEDVDALFNVDRKSESNNSKKRLETRLSSRNYLRMNLNKEKRSYTICNSSKLGTKSNLTIPIWKWC